MATFGVFENGLKVWLSGTKLKSITEITEPTREQVKISVENIGTNGEINLDKEDCFNFGDFTVNTANRGEILSAIYNATGTTVYSEWECEFNEVYIDPATATQTSRAVKLFISCTFNGDGGGTKKRGENNDATSYTFTVLGLHITYDGATVFKNHKLLTD